MRKLGLLFLLHIAVSLHVQGAKYNFIDANYANLYLPGNDSTRLNRFFQKVDTFLQSGEGRINILHIGGSHVQADFISHEVRQRLDALNGNYQTPRGLIFPFSVAKTNNPQNYKVTYSGEWQTARNIQRNRIVPLGMSGIAVYTSDSTAQISLSLNRDGSSRWSFTRLRLLGAVADGSQGVAPVLFYPQDTIVGEWEVESNSYLFHLSAPQDSFQINFIQQDTIPHTFIVNGFLPENDEAGIVYHAIGVNGASVSSYLGCENFEAELPLIYPDLVVFAIGINDASGKTFDPDFFHSQYNLLIEKIKRVNPDCAFIFITNNDSYRRIARKKYAVNPNGKHARNVFYQLAEEHQGGVWDLFEWMGGLKSMQKWQNAGLASRDKIHFNKDGYLMIGSQFYNALINYFNE
ncbi:MAG: hypothetical protein EZS26_002154 [Candidatus Ordinivivax streblomastigis]|uniref:SGNH hydrolase-type esterase domain-containing protein n=1 Tax=Candidatus Ordinivivax streblomastigis TaxID=2540710 RepID=A0A5M8NZU5_9BACT|nr:MAG: hypothetical protein EZS26_002154 [Candidatus Ordinivivax streblomastigis]